MKNYTKIIDQFTNELTCITCDGVGCIPIDPNNKDYQDYLAWVAEGNTPDSN